MITKKFENILWDFDGVILDSNQIREDGFKKFLVHIQKKK